MSKVIIKTDMKSLKILVRKEAISFAEFIHDNYWAVLGGYFTLYPYSEIFLSYEDVYNLFLEDKEKQKV